MTLSIPEKKARGFVAYELWKLRDTAGLNRMEAAKLCKSPITIKTIENLEYASLLPKWETVELVCNGLDAPAHVINKLEAVIKDGDTVIPQEFWRSPERKTYPYTWSWNRESVKAHKSGFKKVSSFQKAKEKNGGCITTKRKYTRRVSQVAAAPAQDQPLTGETNGHNHDLIDLALDAWHEGKITKTKLIDILKILII